MIPTRVQHHSLQDQIELWLIQSKVSKKLLHRLFVLGIIWCSATALLIGVYPPNYSPKANSIAQIHAAVFGSTHEMLAGSRNVIPEVFTAVTIQNDGKVVFTEEITVEHKEGNLNGIRKTLPALLEPLEGNVDTLKHEITHAVLRYNKARVPIRYALGESARGVEIYLGGFVTKGDLSDLKGQKVPLEELKNDTSLPKGTLQYTLQITTTGFSFVGQDADSFTWPVWQADSVVGSLIPRKLGGYIELPKYVPTENLRMTALAGRTWEEIRKDTALSFHRKDGAPRVYFENEAGLDPGEVLEISLQWKKGVMGQFLKR